MSDDDHPICELLARLRPRLGRVLLHWGLPASDAEDTLQETLLAMLLHWEEIETPENWLLRTLHNRCLSYWRRRYRNRLTFVDPPVLALLAGGATPPQDRLELRLDLDTLCCLLPRRQQLLLRFHARLGLTNEEIAAAVGQHAGESIRRDRSRALARLRELAARRVYHRAQASP